MIAVFSSFSGGKVTTLFWMQCQSPHGKFEIKEMLQIADNKVITKAKVHTPWKVSAKGMESDEKNVSKRRLNGYAYTRYD